MRNDVEQAIRKFDIFTFGNRNNIEYAETLLTPNEWVLFVTPTNLTVSYINTYKNETFPGVLFLTNTRILFNCRFLGIYFLETMPLNEILYVNCYDNVTERSHIGVHGFAKTYDISIPYRKGIAQVICQEIESAINNYKAQQAAQNSTPQQNTPQPDIPEQIEKLAQLRDKGIITEEEFQTKKADLLSRL